jgi:hypothetical protein
VPLLGNDDLARIFYEIGDMLEIRGEMAFKVWPTAGLPIRWPTHLSTSPLPTVPAIRRRWRRGQGHRREAGRDWPTPAGCAFTSDCGATFPRRW